MLDNPSITALDGPQAGAGGGVLLLEADHVELASAAVNNSGPQLPHSEAEGLAGASRSE